LGWRLSEVSGCPSSCLFCIRYADKDVDGDANPACRHDERKPSSGFAKPSEKHICPQKDSWGNSSSK
jgi:hypothetical protein